MNIQELHEKKKAFEMKLVEIVGKFLQTPLISLQFRYKLKFSSIMPKG